MSRTAKTIQQIASVVSSLTRSFASNRLRKGERRVETVQRKTNLTGRIFTQMILAVLAMSLLQVNGHVNQIGSGASPSAPRQPEKRRVLVLLPMARDAQGITVSVEDGEMIYQDDIVIDPSQVVSNKPEGSDRKVDLVVQVRRALFGQRQGATSSLFSAGTATWGVNWGRWPDGIIPYKIHQDMPQDKRDLIAQAIDNINSKTNLCFRKKESGDNDYVEYLPVENVSYHGNSALGHKGGRQTIKLNIGNASLKTAVHESLHTAGFIHEQSRSDRDRFIKINWDNIQPGKEGNFEIDHFSENYTTYDFRSVMHYNPTNFGIENADGTRRTTMEPLNPGDTIRPSSTVTQQDINGVNAAYPNAASCNERTKRIKVVKIRADGTLGRDDLVDEPVSSGWSDAEPIFTGSTTTHMMFLNTDSDFAKVRTIQTDGKFGGEVYEKDWTPGWVDLEMLYLGDTTYILHHKRFPLYRVGGVETDVFASQQGFTRISKVNAAAPFDGNALGEKVYEKTWGRGWNQIKFFWAGATPYIFRYNTLTGSAQTFQIDPQKPFDQDSLGQKIYDEVWPTGWNIIRFFKLGDETYCFMLKTGTGHAMIYKMNNSSGTFGPLKYDADWSDGWDNVSFLKHSDGKTYFITIKSSTGKVNYHRFKPNSFSHTTPYEILTDTTWKKGWSHSAFYQSSEGSRLLLIKR